jgi:hypothetical protein
MSFSSCKKGRFYGYGDFAQDLHHDNCGRFSASK